MIRIADSWDDLYKKFLVFFDQTPPGDPTFRLAKDAVLHVIESVPEDKEPKALLLANITKRCPQVLSRISAQEMLASFMRFYDKVRKGEGLINLGELACVKLYVKYPEVVTKIEKAIYRYFLLAPRWDADRQSNAWTLSADDRLALVKGILVDSSVRPFRKWELAQEFQQPSDAYNRDAFKCLLYEGLFADAQRIGIEDTDAVKEVIGMRLNGKKIGDVMRIAELFLPDGPDKTQVQEDLQLIIKGWK